MFVLLCIHEQINSLSSSTSKSLAVTIVVLHSLLHPCSSCPLPGNDCQSLPEDTYTYNDYLINVDGNPDFTLSLNYTSEELAFNPMQIPDVLASETITNDLNPGCSSRNFTITDRVVCPFIYHCDYNPQRIPPYIFHARCISSEVSDGQKCREVFYPVTTLTTESCDPIGSEEVWQLKTVLVAASCVAA